MRRRGEGPHELSHVEWKSHHLKFPETHNDQACDFNSIHTVNQQRQVFWVDQQLKKDKEKKKEKRKEKKGQRQRQRKERKESQSQRTEEKRKNEKLSHDHCEGSLWQILLYLQCLNHGRIGEWVLFLILLNFDVHTFDSLESAELCQLICWLRGHH